MGTAAQVVVGVEARPALRGVMHAIAFMLAIAGTVLLMLLADKPTGYVGGAIFATSLLLLYSTSATYHQVRFWRPAWARVFKRIDHSMIFVLIAGTYTPFCLDVRVAWGIPMLAVVWTLAGFGALAKILRPDAPRWLSVVLYVALGWIAVVAAAEVIDVYLGSTLALLLAGGALYTVGGIVYALQRPDPWPRIFGYHEIFHSFVVAGSAVHYAVIAIYIVRQRHLMWWQDGLWGFWNGLTAWAVLIVHAFGGWDRFPIYNLHRSGNWYDFGFLIGAGSPLLGFFGRKRR